MSDAALWLGRLSSEIGSWASSPRAPVFSAEAAAGAIMGAWFELTEAAAMARRIGDGDAEARLYRFTGWAQVKRGSVEDCTVLAALAVGVALRSCLPTADEVAAWMDEPAGGALGAVPLAVNRGAMMCRHGFGYARCADCGETVANYGPAGKEVG